MRAMCTVKLKFLSSFLPIRAVCTVEIKIKTAGPPGPTTGPPATTTAAPPTDGCGSPQWANDMWCDDENNNADCNWDGGACCFNEAPGWDNYCTVRFLSLGEKF